MLTKIKKSWFKKTVISVFFAVLMNSSYAIDIGTNKNISGEASNIRTQFFNKQGQLQYIIFGTKGDTQGVDLLLKNMLVDFVRKDLKDINLINAKPQLQLYSLAINNEKEVEAFWSTYQHAEAFIYTKKTAINTVEKTARGDAEVKFRSRIIDVDGVGFYADYENRTINIKSKVQIVLRLNQIGDQQKKLKEKQEKKQAKSGSPKNEK